MKENLYEFLAGNEYPGRGICIGKTPDGKKAMIAYFIMGRNVNSRNRVFDPIDGGVGILSDGETKGYWLMLLAMPFHGRAIPCGFVSSSSQTINQEATSRNQHHFAAFAQVKELLGSRPLVLDREFSYLELLENLVLERVNFVIRLKTGVKSSGWSGQPGGTQGPPGQNLLDQAGFLQRQGMRERHWEVEEGLFPAHVDHDRHGSHAGTDLLSRKDEDRRSLPGSEEPAQFPKAHEQTPLPNGENGRTPAHRLYPGFDLRGGAPLRVVPRRLPQTQALFWSIHLPQT